MTSLNGFDVIFLSLCCIAATGAATFSGWWLVLFFLLSVIASNT